MAVDYSMEYKKTISAGGVITKIANGEPYILLIRDLLHTDWVLPKGHVEDGETIEEAALREVREEAGLSNIHIDRLLGTYERLVEKTAELKTIHYFLMFLTKEEDPAITLDNLKDEVRWWPLASLPNFYLPEQKDVVEKNRDVIARASKENSLA